MKGLARVMKLGSALRVPASRKAHVVVRDPRGEQVLEKNVAGFRRLAKFSPYIAGETFTMADCAAYASLPLVSLASKAVYGEDLLAAGGVDWKPYSKLVGGRPSAQRVVADRKTAT